MKPRADWTDKRLEERLARWDPAERETLALLATEKLPRHIAVIMDGNGRWAREHGYKERIHGHRAGITAVRETTETCAELGIAAATLFAFSKENWQRPKREIRALMQLLEQFLISERDGLMDNDIRLIASGHMEDLSEKAQNELRTTMQQTAGNRRMVLNLALSYGGRQEIADAARQLALRAVRGELDPNSISPDTISLALYHPELPDPDLLIRTSGEMRVSNFLLWQVAYTELYVTPVLWPEFRRRHLLEALLAYQQRERRFGRVL
jgi:undecaprenyl diphosphate synthase